MRLSKLFILLILFPLASYTQEKPSFVSLQSGISMPVGMYSSKSFPDGGFTTPGFTVSAEGAWFFKHYLGIGGSMGLYYHPVDAGALAEQKVLADPFLVDMTIRSDPYRSYGLYIGFYGNYHFTEKLSATGKILGGMIYSLTPYQLNKPEYFLVDSKWYEITSAGDYAYSFLLGAGLKYHFKNCMGILLQADYTYNSMNFEFSMANGTRTELKKITFVDLSLGFFVSL